jgi:ligand-binding sensor domain-containing protein/signal transduction histidine kinase
LHNFHPILRRFRECCILIGVLAAVTLARGLDPHKDLRQYGHRSWQTDSGLPQNTVHAITQTRDGYLWLATEGGLTRFDGVQFVVFDKQPPARLPSTNVNSLFEDQGGSLWIGTDDGLVRRRGDSFTTYTTADGLPSNTVLAVFERTEGERTGGEQTNGDKGESLWVVTSGGLTRYSGKERFLPMPVAGGIATAKSVAAAANGQLWIGGPNGLLRGDRGGIAREPLLPGIEIQVVAASLDGNIWAGTRTGLYSIETGKPPGPVSSPVPLPGLPSNEITALTAGTDGSLWIGTAKGAALFRNGALTVYTASEGLPAGRVESIFLDREGAAWIGTGRGLARIFDGRVANFVSPDGSSSELALSLFEDHEGSLWIGTESSGLEMLHDQKFMAYTAAEGLSDNQVRSVTQDRDGSMWIGTNGGGLDRFAEGKFTSLTAANGLSSDIVLALGSDPGGVLWAGTPDGLNRIDSDRRIKVFTSADGLADDFVRSIYAARDGSLWIGTRRGLSHLQNGRFTNYSRLDGVGSDLVGAIVEDRDHSLWIATLGGLTHFASGRFTNLNVHDGLGGSVITALYEDGNGALWVGASQGGLTRLQGGRITAFPPDKTGLPDSVYGILEDGRGNLWLSAKSGVYSVAKRELDDFVRDSSTPVKPTRYGTADGMKIAECSSGGHPAAWKLASGAMWFATPRGIAAIDPERMARNTLPPPVAIEQVFIDDQAVPANTPLLIAPGHRRFEFRYAGLSFIAPQKVRYRYKLEGFDRDWIDAGSRRTADYTNLPPRTYRFRVLACNNDGVWNESGTSLDLRLQPHYYQTLWFYLALLCLLGLLTYQAYRWRLRQVELRYGAVLQERGRIAREIHDTLAQSLVGISVQLELVNRLLTSSVESARAQLDFARNLVRDSIAEARNSIWDLRSQAAETEDFATRIARMAAATTEGATPKIRVKSKISGTYRPLAPRTEAELLRIAQEAVTNAVRHAQPERIEIELRFGARELQMAIHDDGCGFDGQPHPESSGPAGHFGMAGMRERAAQIGARFAIQSASGKGTTVSVHLPLDG